MNQQQQKQYAGFHESLYFPCTGLNTRFTAQDLQIAGDSKRIKMNTHTLKTNGSRKVPPTYQMLFKQFKLKKKKTQLSQYFEWYI